jgi:tetratricopeptide (TPR) repeat protein
MKFLISVFVIALIGLTVYFYSDRDTNRSRKKKTDKFNRKAIIPAITASVLLLGLLIFQMYLDAGAPDAQCTRSHKVTSLPPKNLITAADLFARGNYDYDTGNCIRAITDYTKSIELNPDFPQAFNNRAYTFMRLRDYKDALADLDNALVLNPDYIQALMNRGDIHNYYYAIDRKSAVADYEKVMSLGGTRGTSVCGHLFLARHNGWNIGAILDFPRLVFSDCK